jgi:hypothetical protein
MKNPLILLPLVLLIVSSCYDENDDIYNPDDYESYIIPKIDKSSILANGRSVVNLTISLPVETEASKRSLSFKTSLGTFPDGTDNTITIRVDSIDTSDRSKRVAKFRLRSGQNTGTAIISTTYSGVPQTPVSINFTNAYPTNGTIEADRFSIRNKFWSECVLMATVTSTDGKPSIGNKVQFKVVDQNNVPRALFRSANLSTNADGKTSVIIAINDTTFIGTLVISAKFATNSNNDSLTVSNTLIVTP